MKWFWRWWPWQKFSNWGATRQGRLDGNKNHPPWEESDLPSYINELAEVANREADINKLAKGANGEAEPIKVQNQGEDVLQNLKRAETVCKQKFHPFTPPLVIKTSSFWYKLFIFLLFIFEFPMNAIVFRLFGEAEVFTYIVTFGIALTLLLCAHFLGILLKENDWDKLIRIWGAIGLFVFPMLIIGGVAWLREEYLSTAGEETELLSSLAMYFAFFAFNLIIFFGTMISSYYYHLESPRLNLYKAKKNLVFAKKKLEGANTAIAIAKSERNIKWKICMRKVEWIKNAAKVLCNNYWTENLRWRGDRKEHEDESESEKSFRPLSSKKYPSFGKCTVGELENWRSTPTENQERGGER